MLQIRRGEAGQAQVRFAGRREVLTARLGVGSEVMCRDGEERSQEGTLAGTGAGLSPAAGMDLTTHRLWVRGAQTSTSWAGRGGGLRDSQLVLDGDMHGDVAFLDRNPGKQAAAQSLTSVSLRPGAHLLDSPKRPRSQRALFSVGLCGKGAGNGSGDLEPVEATPTAEQPPTAAKPGCELATGVLGWPPERGFGYRRGDFTDSTWTAVAGSIAF